MLAVFGQLPTCVVVMEACGGARFWGREIGLLGHDVRLIPPAYVKPFVKRQKNDAADAEAICEAAVRPSIRFVPVKSEETQGAAMVFPVRELLIRQRTQAINALRGHLTEFGQIVPQGAANASKLISVVEGPDSGIPAEAIATRERQCKSLPRKWRDSLAAGRVKLCHFGSFWRQGGRGYFQRGTLQEGASCAPRGHERACGGSAFWDFAGEREEDHEFFDPAGLSTQGRDQTDYHATSVAHFCTAVLTPCEDPPVPSWIGQEGASERHRTGAPGQRTAVLPRCCNCGLLQLPGRFQP